MIYSSLMEVELRPEGQSLFHRNHCFISFMKGAGHKGQDLVHFIFCTDAYQAVYPGRGSQEVQMTPPLAAVIIIHLGGIFYFKCYGEG